MNGSALILFALFAVTLLIVYVAIRREWGKPAVVAGAGTAASIILMVLTSVAQGNSALHAIFVGLVVGGGFSGTTLTIAWYFHSTAARARHFGAVTTQHVNSFGEYEEYETYDEVVLEEEF